MRRMAAKQENRRVGDQELLSRRTKKYRSTRAREVLRPIHQPAALAPRAARGRSDEIENASGLSSRAPLVFSISPDRPAPASECSGRRASADDPGVTLVFVSSEKSVSIRGRDLRRAQHTRPPALLPSCSPGNQIRWELDGWELARPSSFLFGAAAAAGELPTRRERTLWSGSESTR